MRTNRLMCFAIMVAASLWMAVNTQAQALSPLLAAAPVLADPAAQQGDRAVPVGDNDDGRTSSGSSTVMPIGGHAVPPKGDGGGAITGDHTEPAAISAYRLAYISEWQRWALILRQAPGQIVSPAERAARKAEILRVLDTASDLRGDATANAGRATARKELRTLVAQTPVENWNAMASSVDNRAATLRAEVQDKAAGNFSVLTSSTVTTSQPALASAMLLSNCAPITVTLTFSGAGGTESGKPKHALSLKGSGDITITATLNPAGTDPSVLSWTGGVAGADNLHRLVHASSAGDTDVTATAPDNSDTIRVHVIDATAPPAAAVDAPKTYNNGGTANPGSNFGLTVVTIGQQGVTAPTYHVDSYFDPSAGKWFFRVRDISHSYKMGTNSQGRIDLPNGNPAVFPLPSGFTLQQGHSQARSDLDTTGLVGIGPLRAFYWVAFITTDHENAHVSHFYSASYWLNYMGLFESQDVESSSVSVVFDCTNSTTTTGTAAVASKTSSWDTAIANRHTAADQAEIPTSETYAHGVSNPEYVPIHNAIPNP